MVSESATRVAVDPAGRRVTVVRNDGGIHMYRLPGLQSEWSVAGDGFTSFGDQIPTGTTINSPAVPSVLRDALRTIPILASIAFSPDGSRLAFGRGLFLSTIDASNGRRMLSTEVTNADPFEILAGNVRFSSDGRTITGQSNQTVGVFDANTLERVALHVSPIDAADSKLTPPIALPDGRVAVTHANGTMGVTREPNADLSIVNAGVGRAAYSELSSDRSRLAVAGDSGIAFISLDGSGLLHGAVPRPRDHLVLLGGPNAEWVITEKGFNAPNTSEDQLFRCTSVRSCAAETGYLPKPYSALLADNGNANYIISLMVGPDPSKLLENVQGVVVDGRTFRPSHPGTFTRSHLLLWGQATDPNERWIAQVYVDPFDPSNPPVIQVNDLHTGAQLAAFGYDLPDPLISLTVNPSGDLIIASNSRGRSFLVDTASWTIRASQFAAGEVALALFSQDGRWLATVSNDGAFAIRDARSFEVVRTFSTSAGTVTSAGNQYLAFSDDGRFLMTANGDAGRLWDVDTGTLIGGPIVPVANTALAALPGKAVGLLSASEQHVRIWQFDPATWPDLACRAAGRNLTQAEWKQYGPRDEPYRKTCEQWPEG